MVNQHTTGAEWQITPDATNDEAYAILQQERVVNCFALADLLPPFRQYTRFALATHAKTAQTASLLIVEHPELHIVSPGGDVAGAAALVASVVLPEQAFIQTLPEHWPLLAEAYDLPSSPRDLLRMSLGAHTFQPAAQPGMLAERLTRDDLAALLALYTLFPTGHFRPDLLEDGVFYGVREGSSLVAAGGTHVIALPFGLAVLGNIFTHPDWRGRGAAQAVVSALVVDLLAQGCQDVILNVEATNLAALHVYTKVGFQPHCHIWSGPAQRR